MKVQPECPKELHKWHNGYPSPPDRIEIKKEMLPIYQLMISDLNNIPIGTIKKSYIMVYHETLQLTTLSETRLKLNKSHRILEPNQLQWLKPYVEFNKRTNRSRKNTDKNEETL